MKNFKVIISLVALIAVGTASAAQKGKKLSPTEIRLLKMALEEQGRILQEASKGKAVTPAIAKNYANQENTIKKYQKEEYPEFMKFVQEKRNELQKSVKNLDSSLEKIKLAMVPKVGIKGAPLVVAAPQLILETAADKATAILIYDEKTGSLKENGIKIYVENTKKKYPAIATNNLKLVIAAYDDAAAILKTVRTETALDQEFSNKLLRMINDAVSNTKTTPEKFAEILESIKKPIALEPISLGETTSTDLTQEELSKILKESPKLSKTESPIELDMKSIIDQLNKSKNWNEFIDLSVKNSQAFYKNNQITQRWFNLAVEMAQKFGPTITNPEMRKTLTDGAKKMLQASNKLLLTQGDIDNINTSLDLAITEDNPLSTTQESTPIKSIDQPKIEQKISPSLLGSKSLIGQSINPTTQSKLESPQALPIVSEKLAEITSETAMLPQLMNENTMELLHQSKSINEFFAITNKNLNVFYNVKNMQLQQNWFNLAVNKIYEFEAKKNPTSTTVYDYLKYKVYELYTTALGRKGADKLNNPEKGDVEICLRRAFKNNGKELS